MGEKKLPTEDSLDHYPPTPPTISKETYRALHRVAHRFYDSMFNNDAFNGAFLVAKSGHIVYERYRGTRHLYQQDTIDANTAFHIASTSKTFTAMGILKLYEEGKLSLEDGLQQYFPNFPYPNITIKMLLNHRSGLPNYAYFMDPKQWSAGKRVTNRDVLEAIIQNKPGLSFPVGKRFSYSNTNYVLLALIIEQVSGKTYHQFMYDTFFAPLGMQHTKVFEWKDSATATPSYRWNGRLEPYTYLDETYGDKNIYSTARDLLKWDQALYNQKLFKSSTLEAAFAPYSFEKPGRNNYGLGWRMHLLPDNKKVIYHNGWWHGNNASFYRVVSDSITIIVLGNKYNQRIYKVKPLIEAMTSLRFDPVENEE